MDRPKQLRFILVALVLLAGGVLLLGRQWMFAAPDSRPALASAPAAHRIETQADEVEPAAATATAPSAVALPSGPASTAAVGFRGRIIDAVTRQPVKEFEVQLIRVKLDGGGHSEDEPITRKFTSQTGRFAWSDVAAGTWRSTVSARGYQQFNVDNLEIAAGKATREFVMPLLRGYAVRGRVYELSTGAGIVGAWISFRPAGPDEDFFRRRPRTASKEDGSFTLDGVPGGDVVLIVHAAEHGPRDVRIVVDEKTPPQEIALSTGGTIAGTVTTAAGAPVKGSIQLLGPGMNFFSETNEDGQFSYKHMRPGLYTVSADTSAGSVMQDIALGQDEIKDGIVLVVAAGRSIRGMVVGLRPDQVKDVYIVLRSDSNPGSFSAKPDQQGAYALNGVPAGRAVISALSRGRQFDRTIDVPADQDLTLDLVFPPGARLSGRVTQGGKPVVSKNVWMRPVDDKSDTLYQAMTSADGQYEIEGLPPGDYRLRADEDISRAITMAGDAVLNIDIPLVQLAARVVEDGGAVPIVGAKVHVRGSEPETARVRSDKETDHFGQFALTGIEPGEIVLMVYKPGYELHREKIAYSSPITDRTIALRKDAGVEVRVKTGSRRFPIGFTLTEYVPGNDYEIDLWMPLDREGMCHVPSALAGTTLNIGRFSGKPIVIEEWDGQSFELP